MLIWVLKSSQCSKIRLAQHWGRRRTHLSENEGVRSKNKKFGENSIQMAPVSTICDEYCRKCESKHWYACGADGRSGGRAVSVQSCDYQIFSDGWFSYPWCFAREKSAITVTRILAGKFGPASPCYNISGIEHERNQWCIPSN